MAYLGAKFNSEDQGIEGSDPVSLRIDDIVEFKACQSDWPSYYEITRAGSDWVELTPMFRPYPMSPSWGGLVDRDVLEAKVNDYYDHTRVAGSTACPADISDINEVMDEFYGDQDEVEHDLYDDGEAYYE